MGFGGHKRGLLSTITHQSVPIGSHSDAFWQQKKKARRSGHRAFLSTGGRSRTGTPLRAPDFESGASTNFATPAGVEGNVTKFFDVGQPQNVIEPESLADTKKTVCDLRPNVHGQRPTLRAFEVDLRAFTTQASSPSLKKMQRYIHLHWHKHAASDLPRSVHPHHSHRPPQRSQFDTAFQARRRLSTGRGTNRMFVPGLWGHPLHMDA